MEATILSLEYGAKELGNIIHERIPTTKEKISTQLQVPCSAPIPIYITLSSPVTSNLKYIRTLYKPSHQLLILRLNEVEIFSDPKLWQDKTQLSQTNGASVVFWVDSQLTIVWSLIVWRWIRNIDNIQTINIYDYYATHHNKWSSTLFDILNRVTLVLDFVIIVVCITKKNYFQINELMSQLTTHP